MNPNLTEAQVIAANEFMAPRFTGNGVYLAGGQFVFSKVGDDVILTDTETDDTVNLGPEVE